MAAKISSAQPVIISAASLNQWPAGVMAKNNAMAAWQHGAQPGSQPGAQYLARSARLRKPHLCSAIPSSFSLRSCLPLLLQRWLWRSLMAYAAGLIIIKISMSERK
jgi:hypothetical protein